MPEPQHVSSWLRVLLPVLREGSAALSLFFLVALIASVWWLSAWTRDCVAHNRDLGARLLAEQHAFRQEMLILVARCQSAGKE